MSQENVEVVRRFFEGFDWYAPRTMNADDPLWETLDPNIECFDHDILDAENYMGREGFLRWLDFWDEPWEEWSMEAGRWIDVGDRVVLLLGMTTRGRESGVEMTRHDGIVWTLRDGRVIRIDYYNSEAQALEAMGLRE